MNTFPGLWKSESIERILVDHGLVVINRTGSEPHQFIFRYLATTYN